MIWSASLNDYVLHPHLQHYDLPAYGWFIRQPEGRMGQTEIRDLPNSRLIFKKYSLTNGWSLSFF
ncbi:hypothetical protein [Paenibacillus sp. MZ03-122A]|uniref:hypothetical protein n=1 Tax=Paenibacillus sp. MZ03-122A TaxID=2962033 RepID=UPI0020B6B059|nr:hypothetical protein [Paenibacillus sp. MZ03-122A]MCP3781454.1 hypothetical protein [Paenibacillus sp. MZ03-122A]